MPPIWAGRHLKDGDEVSTDPGDYVFFLSKDEVPHGCFSNAFREENGHRALSSDDDADKFWCVNQELHYQKAVLFRDVTIAGKILGERDDAGKIKQFGRMVEGYDDDKWCEVRYQVCKDAVHAKFSQNPELKDTLLGTGKKIILEAARDRVWGIGCVEFSSQNEDGSKVVGAKNVDTGKWDTEPNDWVGENFLGRCLMDVREELSG